jgi:hypothetical protein
MVLASSSKLVQGETLAAIVHIFSRCCVAGQLAPAATLYAPDDEQVAETVPPVEQVPTQVKPGAWLAH